MSSFSECRCLCHPNGPFHAQEAQRYPKVCKGTHTPFLLGGGNQRGEKTKLPNEKGLQWPNNARLTFKAKKENTRVGGKERNGGILEKDMA